MTLKLALEWALQGHRVLPVNPTKKAPLIRAWQDNCTTDAGTIVGWWAQHDTARVGLATGKPGYDVLDFDVTDGKPGMEQLEKLMDLGILEAGTFDVVATPRGGRHLYFEGSDQRNKQNEKAIPGVDFRGAGGMVLAAGNPGYKYVARLSGTRAPVDWERVRAALAPPSAPEAPRTNSHPPPPPSMPPPPPVVSTAVPGGRTRGLVSPASSFDDAPGEESPFEWYNRTTTLEELLSGAGWQYAGERQGREDWIRPGKKATEGVSGNVSTMDDGRRVFYNFSSSVDLPTDTAMSPAQLYSWLEHGGDMRGSAGTIRRSLMPRRMPPTTAPAPPRATQPGPPGTQAPQPAPVAPVGSPGTDLVPSGEVGPPAPVREFWQRRPELREVYWKAQRGGVSPWALLGRILASVSARVGPHVCLPPPGGVGAPSSLNMLIAISGNSGTGKGLSRGVGAEFIGPPNVPQRKPGTGQGIAAIFTEQTKDGPIQTNDTALLNVEEITGLGAHADMQGSNLVSTLLEVYMGEELGEHYANKEKRRPVPEGRYRLALTAGVQPGNSHIILDHAESGFPQRFIWLPAFWSDTILPESGLQPPAPDGELPRWRAWSAILPGSLDDSILATGWSPSDAAGGLQSPNKKKDSETEPVPVKDTVVVKYAPAVKREVDRDRNSRLNALKKRQAAGEDDPGDPESHAVLARLKVAAHLAIWLDHTLVVSEEIWDLSRWVMWVSTDTRAGATRRLINKAADRSAERAHAQVTITAMVREAGDAKSAALVLKVADRIRTVVGKADGGWVSNREVTLGLAGRDKKAMREMGIELGDILGDLVLTGVLEHREPEGAGQGARYRTRR